MLQIIMQSLSGILSHPNCQARVKKHSCLSTRPPLPASPPLPLQAGRPGVLEVQLPQAPPHVSCLLLVHVLCELRTGLTNGSITVLGSSCLVVKVPMGGEHAAASQQAVTSLLQHLAAPFPLARDGGAAAAELQSPGPPSGGAEQCTSLSLEGVLLSHVLLGDPLGLAGVAMTLEGLAAGGAPEGGATAAAAGAAGGGGPDAGALLAQQDFAREAACRQAYSALLTLEGAQLQVGT